MIKTFKELLKMAQKNPRRVSVASAEDDHVLKAVIWAKKKKIADFILIGDESKIKSILHILGGREKDYEIVHSPQFEEAASLAADYVIEGKANAIMKGLLPSPVFLKAVVNPSAGLIFPGDILSHVALMKVPKWKNMFIATDCAVNISPSVEEKIKIIRHAIYAGQKVGIIKPNVALVTASEVVNQKMKDTLDVELILKQLKNIQDAVIGGPFALDNAISVEAALIKKITHPGAGNADILVFPDLSCSNVFYKSLIYYARAESAGVILGAKAPVILVSRSDSEITKLNSIAFACVLSK